MSQLAPVLFDLRYQDLVTLGESRLPSFAPDWTDYNAHDPGITFIELLAWVAEAQMYSLGHVRRDERAAYAALFGLAAAGTRAASGLLWADPLDPQSPSSTFSGTLVIDSGAAVRLRDDNDGQLLFRPQYRTLWAPGQIVRLASTASSGAVRDLTSINQRGGAVFLPFGETAGPRDVLSLEFETRADEGILPPGTLASGPAYWMIGIRAVDTALAPSASPGPLDDGQNALTVTLIVGSAQTVLPIVSDTSNAMLSTGVIVLDLSKVAGSPKSFVLEFRAPRGLPRPPRLLRIEPNVLPITQRTRIEQEPHPANGLPDLSFELDVPGLSFDAGEEPVLVEVSDGQTSETWVRCDHLSDQGPDDSVYELDPTSQQILFGNGLNGRRPAESAQVLMTYSVSDGAQGNVARNRHWVVDTIDGVFGVNPDPASGGSDPLDWIGLRRAARGLAQDSRALISSADVEAAALALPLLEVARAWVLAPQTGLPNTGTVTLVAMRSRPGGVEPAQPPETARWLDAIRRQLAGQMPLGTTLAVVAPRYVDFTVRLQVQAQRGVDPAQVANRVRDVLKTRLAMVSFAPSVTPRAPGVQVNRQDVYAWIRDVDGLSDVTKVDLVVGQAVTIVVKVPPDGLPRFDLANSQINVARAAPGSAA